MKKAEHRQPCEQPFKIIDLFAGIGGFSLAGHWRGWETAAFVEKEPYCQKVLAKNFTGVPIIEDIRNYKPKKHAADIICGGFPCQPFSSAGKRGGKEDDRYLWPEMLRVIREVQPTYVIGENVAGLLSMDGGVVFEEICLSLEAEGYAVQPFVIPAISKGAPHRRDRVWIVGYSEQSGLERKKRMERAKESTQRYRQYTPDASIENDRRHQRKQTERQEHEFGIGFVYPPAPNAVSQSRWSPAKTRLEMEQNALDKIGRHKSPKRCSACDREHITHANFIRPQGSGKLGGRLHTEQNRKGKVNRIKYDDQFQTAWYEVATRLCRVDDGLPSWVDGHRTARLKALGNAIVPQVADALFAAIEQHYIETRGCACI